MSHPFTRSTMLLLRACALATLTLAGLLATAGADAAPTPRHKKAQAAPARTTDDPAEAGYAQRPEALRFAEEAAARRGFDPTAVRGVLAQARFLPVVARLVMPPPAGTAKNWAAYRARFLEPLRIRAGLAFWETNQAWLERAEAIFGVPPEIVVGIVGVETLYGRQTGTFRVLDALATLAFDFPEGRSDRSAYFRDELEAFLVLCRTEGRDPLQVKGSYAGAMGLPQFMPSSFNRWAIDFDGDGRTDLDNSAADVIGSVANFLAAHGWRPGLVPRLAVTPPADVTERAVLLAPDIVPTFTAAEMTSRGARLDATGLAPDEKLALVEVQNGDSAPPSQVAGTTNFYAITRYNQSSYYALAVIELGEAVKRERAAR